MTGQERNSIIFVTDAIRQIFGINSPIFFPYGTDVPLEVGEFRDIVLMPEPTDGDSETRSEFGLPVLAPIFFEAGEYDAYDPRTGAVIKQQMQEFALPFSSIVEFSAGNNVVTTAVQGGSGTVKELFSMEDWQITIRGIALSSRRDQSLDAHEQTDQLVRWRELCDSIAVRCSEFRRKGIYNIVIERLSIMPVVGKWNAIPFQIEARSDMDIELYDL